MSPPTDADVFEWIRWFRTTDETRVVIVREALTSVAVVLAVGVFLFAVSGIWPPMVAVESGSMEPHMQKGDLIFVVDETRIAGSGAYAETGIVPSQTGKSTGYREFHGYGDVIIYQPNGNERETPIIHRVRFWVTEGENWYAEADPNHLAADGCVELRTCPAPNSGFITLGDNNQHYDQSNQMGLSAPVKPAWVIGKAKLRIPWLGWIRLTFSALA